MVKKKTAANSEKLAEIIIQGIQDKKGQVIKLIDLRKVNNAISDFFIVCHASSNRQVDSIADSVFEFVQNNTGEKPFNVEGKRQSEWVLLDYVDVVVHVFQEKLRDHYALEDLWADAHITQIED
jgi:ribosome-associated protein